MTNTKEDLREEFMEFISQECYDLAKYKAGKYDNKIWSWVEKALQPQREEMGNKLREKMEIDYGTLHGSGGNVRELVIDENEFNKILKND